MARSDRADMSSVVGIDPGATGALVRLDAKDLKVRGVWDCPQDDVEWRELMECLNWDTPPWLAVVERQQYMPKGGRMQGGKSAFSLGVNYGIWQGVLKGLAVETITVPPTAWQRYVYGSGTAGGPKERALRRAKELFPDMPLVPDGCRVERHGRADAALIALYGVGVLKKRGLI